MSRSQDERGTITIVKEGNPAKPLAVIVSSPKAKPSSFRLRGGMCVIGSGDDCNLVLRDPTVSRNHVELALVPEGIRVRDLGSRNGTYYLGQRIGSMVLSPCTRITLG